MQKNSLWTYTIQAVLGHFLDPTTTPRATPEHSSQSKLPLQRKLYQKIVRSQYNPPDNTAQQLHNRTPRTTPEDNSTTQLQKASSH
jgi:hypothetical protein